MHGDAATWGPAEHLLASIIEAIDAASWRTLSPHLKKGFKPKVVTVPRPGDKAHRRRRRATSHELKQMFPANVVHVPKEV